MPRSASTFSLNDSTKSSVMVQRSNSLDHPPVRTRVPVSLRTPCSPAPNPPDSPVPTPAPNLCPSPGAYKPKPISYTSAPTRQDQANSHTTRQSNTSTLATVTSVPAGHSPKSTQPKSSQYMSRPVPPIGVQHRSLAPQPANSKSKYISEPFRDSQVPLDQTKALLTTQRKETLL